LIGLPDSLFCSFVNRFNGQTISNFGLQEFASVADTRTPNSSPDYFILRGKLMTLCRPRCGPGGAKAPEPNASWRCSALGTRPRPSHRRFHEQHAPSASQEHRAIAFAPEGLRLGHSFTADNPGQQAAPTRFSSIISGALAPLPPYRVNLTDQTAANTLRPRDGEKRRTLFSWMRPSCR